MPSWSDLLGRGSIAEQLLVWGLLNQLLGDLLGPTLDLVTQGLNEAQPVQVNSPADLADAVVRGAMTQADAEAEAAKSGLNTQRFDRLLHLAGEPIGLEQVLEAWRRGLIGWDDAGLDTPSVERAIKTARYFDYWGPVIQGLADVPLTVGEAVNALLRGQTDQATALAEAKANGINPDRFAILLDSAGRPPAPGELVELMRRKLIPKEGVGPGVVSFQQGIYEGDSKDKWWALLADLADYRPPPRTVTALLRTGSITDAQAQGFFQDAGMSADLAAAYSKNARGEKLAGTRHLAEATITTLYETQAITAADATAHLLTLGYDTADAGLILELADLQRELRAINSAVTRIGTLYVGHKITRQAATDALDALGVTGAHQAHQMATWDTEAAANVRLLTPAQILKAYKLGNISEAEAKAELEHLGYTPRDAQILAWNELDTTGQGLPSQGPAGPGAVP